MERSTDCVEEKKKYKNFGIEFHENEILFRVLKKTQLTKLIN